VITGVGQVPNLPKLKHFGAAASSSGGVEMFHLVGITPEANTAEQAYGGNKPTESRHYGAQERAQTLARINATGQDRKVDYVMLGCPHYTIEQIWEAAQLIEGRKVHPDAALWIWTRARSRKWRHATATRRSSRTPAARSSRTAAPR
jgi:predicted aconitase